ARGLEDHPIDVAAGPELVQRLQQIRIAQAADAALGELDHRSAGGRAHVDPRLPQLVLDQRDAEAVRSAEELAENGGLSGSEEAGEDDDRQWILHAASLMASCRKGH